MVKKKRPVKKRRTVSRVPWKEPLAVVLYGPSGVGKSSFCAQFPKPVFLCDTQEKGIVTLGKYKRVPQVEVITVHDFHSVLRELVELRNSDFETIVVESLTGVEKYCFKQVCSEHYDGNMASFMSYFQGPRTSARDEWPKLFDACESVVEAGKNIIVTAHAHTKPFPNPEGPDFERWTPYCDKESWQVAHRWARCVLFYNYHYNISQEGTRKKVKSREQRFLFAEWQPTADAKNQYGLPALIDAGDSGKEAYQAFVKCFEKV
jgi:hypothetical protein